VPFRGMHRYLPAIFRHAGLRVTEVAVNHRARARAAFRSMATGIGRLTGSSTSSA
jgi:hypothetical protein